MVVSTVGCDNDFCILYILYAGDSQTLYEFGGYKIHVSIYIIYFVENKITAL